MSLTHVDVGAMPEFWTNTDKNLSKFDVKLIRFERAPNADLRALRFASFKCGVPGENRAHI